MRAITVRKTLREMRMSENIVLRRIFGTRIRKLGRTTHLV
jgi:hypothetical protein